MGTGGNRAKDSSSIVERTSLQAFSVMTFRVVGADTKAIIPSSFCSTPRGFFSFGKFDDVTFSFYFIRPFWEGTYGQF